VADRHRTGAEALRAELAARQIRADLDASEETIAKRIRAAELEKIPYVIVYGDKEAEGGALALRVRGEEGVSTMERGAALDSIEQAARL
jgi:threonyl-tRNA synthetase